MGVNPKAYLYCFVLNLLCFVNFQAALHLFFFNCASKLKVVLVVEEVVVVLLEAAAAAAAAAVVIVVVIWQYKE